MARPRDPEKAGTRAREQSNLRPGGEEVAEKTGGFPGARTWEASSGFERRLLCPPPGGAPCSLGRPRGAPD